jgi:hypothetical protein
MRKSKLFLAGMAALLLSFGLVLAGCPTEDGGGDEPGSGSSLTGTWTGSGDISDYTLVFTATTWTQAEEEGSTMSGSYTYAGTSLTLQVTQLEGESISGTAVINGSTLTLSSFPEMADLNGTYTKEGSSSGGDDPVGGDDPQTV